MADRSPGPSACPASPWPASEDLPDIVADVLWVLIVNGVRLIAHQADAGTGGASLCQADALGDSQGPGHHSAVRPSLERMENPR